MDPRDPQTSVSDDPTDELTRYFVQEYLMNARHSWTSVRALPEADYERIMAAASAYASTKLSEAHNKIALAKMIRNG